MIKRCLRFFAAHPLAIALFAMALTLPSLGAGLLVDDYGMYLAVRGSEIFADFSTSPLDLFRFFDGSPERVQRLMNLGIVPWWTYPELKGAFWRPVSSLTHYFDYRVWGDVTWAMHLESVLLYGAVGALVTLLYRRVLGVTAVAGLAALLYVMDHTHALPVVFLANRNAILALFFGLLCILSHLSWRRHGRRAAAWWSHLFLALSLLSAEAGIATGAYLVAHALTLETGSWKARLAPLATYGVMVVAWRIAWSLQGYGVEGCGIYTDPARDPLAFLHALVERVPLLFLAQWFTPPAELNVILDGGPARIHRLGAWLALAVVAVAVWPLARRHRTSRFFAVGMLLSFVPLGAAFPSDRMLLFAGVGAFGLMAEWISAVFSGPSRVWTRLPVRIVAVVGMALLLLRAALSPFALAVGATAPMGSPEGVNSLICLMPLTDGDEERDLVVVNPPLALFHTLSLAVREVRGMETPRSLRMLTPGWSGVEIEREDQRTLVVRPERGFKDRILPGLFRSEAYPMKAGDRVDLDGLSIEVLDVAPNGLPTVARFRFDAALEDASLRWYAWSDGAYHEFAPPDIGESLNLQPVRFF